MFRPDNRNRNRGNSDKGNRNRSGNSNDRRRNDGNRGNFRRNDQDNRVQLNRFQQNRMQQNRGGGGYLMNMGGYQNVAAYSQQAQVANYAGGYGSAVAAAASFQQNRFGMSQPQRINPWASNIMPGMASSGNEAKLAMNILNAVLSTSGAGPSGRGMSPPPNKMRRMNYREGGYDDRRRRPRSPPGRSHQNRQQSSQRFGSNYRGRDDHSSNQRNDDHRVRNSNNKNSGMTRSSRQSSLESSEFVFRKRLSFVEREKEINKYKDLPAKSLKCRMCEKLEFQSVTAFLAHVDSKGHSKVARAFHEKIAAMTSVLKQNAKLALHKKLMKEKANGRKVETKECRVCEAPMVYGNLKHKNILACKIMHKFHNQTLCCGKDHKTRSLVEEHCLSLEHLKTKYELEHPGKEGETSQDEVMEDEQEKISRQKRDRARRKRKYGDDETDEEEDEDEEEEEEVQNDNEKDTEATPEDMKEVEVYTVKEADTKTEGTDKEKTDSCEENADEAHEKEDEDQNASDGTIQTSEKEDENINADEKDNEIKEDYPEEPSKEEDDIHKKEDNRRIRISGSKKEDFSKNVQQMTLKEMFEYYIKHLVHDPEKVGPYDSANPIGLNFIETHVSFHCMACIEYYPASTEELMAHCCSEDHYKTFRSKYMKLQGVRDSPTSLKRLKDAQERTKRKSNEKEGREHENKEESKGGDEGDAAAGDDALYDPYEGESGDLTTMLQEKKNEEEHEGDVPEGYEVQDEVHGSEADNYEDNMLDYEEDVGDETREEYEEENQGEEAECEKQATSAPRHQGNVSQKDKEEENEEYQEYEEADDEDYQDDDGEEYQDDNDQYENEPAGGQDVNDDEDNENQENKKEGEEYEEDESEEYQGYEDEEYQGDENEDCQGDDNEEYEDDQEEYDDDDEQRE
ncbi:hypothetical protein SK128_025726 [Halocaridina rubra]|uniref:Uncharacterized protein n=1 Tax=Halocaridina rubra TaxID=373956 RepID=A0AAN9A0B2_HALRR